MLSAAMRAGMAWRAWLAAAIWGGSFVATRIALESFEPFALVALRFALGTGVLACAALARGAGVPLRRSDRVWALLLGLVLAAHIGLQTYGLAFTAATHASWIVCFSAVTVAFGGQVFLGQRLAPIGWLGVIVAIAGVATVVSHAPADLARAGFGDLLQLTGCVTWALYTLLGAGVVARNGALGTTLAAMGAAALALAALVPLQGIARAPIDARAIVALGYLGILSSGVAFFAWFRAQELSGTQKTAAALYLEPFVTALVATRFGEPITARTLLGGIVLLSGTWLVGRGARASAPSR
jgi:drug/metabolite transporter (DMT)-like permease